MSPSRRERSPWEYAGGPQAGSDVPVSGEPREEQSPGVPRRSDDGERRRRRARARGRPPTRDSRLEDREVRAADPELSPEANRALTEELRDVVGADHVRVPADRPRASHGEVPVDHGFFGYLSQRRFELVRTTAIMLTFGAIVSLATGNWWLLPLAAGVHALGTMTVMLTVVRMTTLTEHPSPEVAAEMAEEGVASPDERFSRMVREFSPEGDRGAGEVLSPGHGERTAPAGRDAATASSEQASAMTPTEDPSSAGGTRGQPDLLIWATAFSLLVLSIVLPPLEGGGWMWLLTAVMVPLIGGWVVMQRLLARGSDKVQVRGRRPMVAIALCTALAVAIFCGVVALAFSH